MIYTQSNSEERILRLTEVESICGIKKSTIRRHELAGFFPKRVKIGTRSVGWKLSEIRERLDNLNNMEAEV
ncbi:helix-turn-helix transcriptional regulator [Endozoicomonas acroporae]|uniref:helix-turn-helix transcriptional regulator n=1 Tax=Endozoicomonas acroporae TaxID=1701104 RepID=UPI0013CF8396|nr:AlpA family phage regulatory protein [Endozoicomonas acroporae]